MTPDYSKGFGGKYGVQKDRQDTTGTYDDTKGVSSSYQKPKVETSKFIISHFPSFLVPKVSIHI